MPPLPGEETLLTLFADAHYYFSDPTYKPVHHRFEKGSYVYLHKNSIQRRGRVEIANNAGTADQDAFDGFLDDIFLQYSYKHDTLFTLTVEGRSQADASPTLRDTRQWHIPGPDQHNQGRYMLKIHTLDLYFWTKEDALQFLDGARKVLPESQMRILNAPVPPTSHQDSISPVVQKLEHAAISDPSYRRSKRASESGDTSAASLTASPIVARAVANNGIHGQPDTAELPPNFVPMAYNPSAPAAPEPIAHREKTPPPPDMDQSGTGLGTAATHDHYDHHYGQHQVQAHGSFPPPPPSTQNQGQPPHPGTMQRQQTFPNPPVQRQSTFAGPPAGLPPGQTYGSHSPSPSGPSPVPGHLQRAPTAAGSFPPPPPGGGSSSGPGYQHGQDPGQQYQQHSTPPPPQRSYTAQQQYSAPPTGHPQPQYAIQRQSTQAGSMSPHFAPTPSPGIPPQTTGGYSNYQYGATTVTQGPQTGQEQYGVHQQAYRPTQIESQSHVKPAAPTEQGQNTQPSRVTGAADKVGKGIGGLLKKVEKRIG
ncbi:MAG: hypothetical protein M1814_000937 [Vezdaea aestivalis]|nr:MAG: hypothetical protein M1814_000937 [Vezdaea aestivalis]